MSRVTHSVVEAIRSSAVSRRNSLSRLRRETRAALAERRRMRRVAARNLRTSLHAHRVTRIASLGAGPAPHRPGVIDESNAGEAPLGSGGGLWEFQVDVVDEERLADDALRAEILRVVDGKPLGAAAREIGNALGVDWRRVVTMMPKLVDEEVVDRLGPHFYVRKASKRW